MAADQSIAIQVDTCGSRCGEFEDCRVSVSGDEIALSVIYVAELSADERCLFRCTVDRVTCQIPPLEAGDYLLRYTSLFSETSETATVAFRAEPEGEIACQLP